MALGDGGNQGQRRSNEDSYNSRLTLYSPDGNKYLKFKFWAGKISVSINVGENTQDGFRYKETIAAYLTPLKAKIMADELRGFIENKKSDPVGIVIGSGDPNTCLTFLYDKDSNVMIDICKVDGSGKRTAGDSFTIQKDYHYSVTYKNYDKLDFSKKFYNDIELQGIIDLFDSFYMACNGSTAYSVLDMSRFNYGRLKSNTEAIMDKLGIQRASSRGSSGNSFFSNNRQEEMSGYSDHVEDINELL